MITVVGAGPRGLSAALIAISKGKKVTLIDPEPFSTWQTPQTLPDFEMRSPITFDLVTGAGEDLQIYSLAQFLNRDIPYSEDQRTIESCSVRATRSQFTDYLQHVFNLLLPQVTYLKDPVVSIKPDRVITNYHVVDSEKIIIALGKSVEEPRCPEWVSKSQYQEQIIKGKEILDPSPGRYLVIGSGQQAAEHILHLISKGVEVACTSQKAWTPYDYPVPDYRLWYHQTALGSYYQNLKGPSAKRRYLMEVKLWQPTISPSVFQALCQTNYLSFKGKSTEAIQEWLGEDGKIVLASGQRFVFGRLPLSRGVKASLVNSQWPELVRFRLPDAPSICFTGIAALTYGGPAQGSLISAARTAKEILNV